MACFKFERLLDYRARFGKRLLVSLLLTCLLISSVGFLSLPTRALPEKVVYRISINSTFHSDYGLMYPVTYIFQIPSASSNLKAYKRSTTSESWTQLAEKSTAEFFNGIECVRFDYSQSKAHVSVAFSAASDDIYIRITNLNGELVETSFSAVSKYYDSRQATVVVTSDDWTGEYHNYFMEATDVCQADHVWFTPGLWTHSSVLRPGSDLTESNYEDIQTQLNEGYLEVASHSRTHPHVPYSDYDSEIGGSRDDIISHLSLPAIYTKGASEYVWAWLEPYDEWDLTTRAKLGQYRYLIDRTSTRPAGYPDFATWDSVNGVYNRIGIVGYGDTETLQDLNDLFDSSYGAGEIYHLFFHAQVFDESDWGPTGTIPQHLDHLKDKLDVWYVGFGALYAYQFVKENLVMATFTENTYPLTVSTVGSGSVVKVPDQALYYDGDNVQLTATPDPSWSFSAWSGDISSSLNPVSVTIDRATSVTAIFIQNGHSLTINTVGSGSVSKVPDQASYTYGTVVTLQAAAASDYTFDHWGGDLSGTTNPTTITMTSDKTVTATFTQDQYTLTVNVVGAGCSVTKSPDQTSYTYGTSVQLTPVAASGWRFSDWSGDLTGRTVPGTISMTGSKTVTATFTENQYPLTFGKTTIGPFWGDDPGPAGGGYVTACRFQAPEDGTITQISAHIRGTSESGLVKAMIYSDVSGEVGTLLLESNQITLSSSWAWHNFTASYSIQSGNYYWFAVYASVDLRLSYDTGQTDQSADAVLWTYPLVLTNFNAAYYYDAVFDIYATYEQNSYFLAVSTVGSGSVTKVPDQATYTYGTSVQLTASPTAGWSFSGWGGDLTGSTNPIITTMNANKTVTATFAQLQYALLVSISPTGSGSVSLNSSGPYHYGDNVQLTPIPTINWTFAYWSGDLSDSINPAVIVMNGNKTVAAYFTIHDVAVTEVVSFSTQVYLGNKFNVTVTVRNIGLNIESFNVTLFCDTTSVEIEALSDLMPNSTTTLTFTWNTTGFAYGEYTISVYATPVQGETNTADNARLGGTVFVAIPGDVNVDGKVDSSDLSLLNKAYGSTPSSPNWNQNCDVDGDRKVDITDIFSLGESYGETRETTRTSIAHTSIEAKMTLPFSIVLAVPTVVARRRRRRQGKTNAPSI